MRDQAGGNSSLAAGVRAGGVGRDDRHELLPRTESSINYRDDRWLDAAIGRLLSTGVLLAAAVVVIGAVILLRQDSQSFPAYQHFRSEPSQLRDVGAIARGALAGGATAIIQLGLVLLIATPIVRVTFSAVVFVVERDPLYVVITLIVLSVLMYGLLHH